MLNRVILIGRLTRDPELRLTAGGTVPVANFSLAVDRPFAKEGQPDVDFIDCVAWRSLGETVAKYMTKGRLVAVEGRLAVRTYETQDGGKRRVAEVVCDRVRFLDRKPKEPEADAVEEAVSEDVPF
jgi:single-strand DNA-binding protein